MEKQTYTAREMSTLLLTERQRADLREHCLSYMNNYEHRTWVVRADYGLALLNALEVAEARAGKAERELARKGTVPCPHCDIAANTLAAKKSAKSGYYKLLERAIAERKKRDEAEWKKRNISS